MSADYLSVAKSAATAAGRHLRDGFRGPVAVTDERGKDIKTRADQEAESLILGILAQSGDLPVLAEESGMHAGLDTKGQMMWIVDPLDGTLNYTRGLPLCCVSVALWKDGNPVLGVVYDFLRDRLYSGVVDLGAWCNDTTLRVSAVTHSAQAVIATGFPSGTDYADATLMDFVRRVQRYKKVRLLGSAALSLAEVATGTMDVYSEQNIYLWDVAAGLALVKAAGGDYQLGPLDDQWRCNVSATNGHLAFA